MNLLQTQHRPRAATPLSLLGFALSAAIVAAPSVASAQYVSSTGANPYVPLTSPTVITTDVDDGQTTVTPPFAIDFYGARQATMSVGNNGAIFFPTGSVSFSNRAPNDPASPNNWIGPVWDDLRLYPANNGYIGYETTGTAPNRVFAVEWRNISFFSASSVIFSMQVRFHEGGGMDVDYSAAAGTGSISATMGMEDAAGANGFFFAASACTTNCSQADLTALANMRVSVSNPPEPQLTGIVGILPAGIEAGTVGSIPLTLTNLGTDTATSVTYNVWVSADTTLDMADLLGGSYTQDVAFGDTTVTATIGIPAMFPSGNYYVILEMDSADVWTETDETDNVVVSAGTFATAFDIQCAAVRVMNLAGINAGEMLNLEIDVINSGIPFTGSLEIDLGASVDLSIDATDPSLGLVSIMLSGATAETLPVSIALPALVPGSYHSFAIVDPNDRIAESNELNNQFLDNSTFDTGPDFLAASVVVPIAVAPGASANIATTIDSVAVAFTGNVPYRLYASEDTTLDTMMDIDLGAHMAAMAGEATLVDTEAVTFPASMAPGDYYVIAVINPMAAITEVSMANNQAVSATTIANAADFFAENVTSGPNGLEIGETLTVTADARNTGLPFTGNVPFSIYVSNDPTWDPGDQSIHNGLVFFTGTDTGAPINVSLPLRALPGDAQIRPGGYTIIVRIDSTELHVETNEMNNWDAGGRITLEGADLLAVSITAPPVAFIGMPLRVAVDIENQGVADANGFTYSFFLSSNDIIRVNDQRIYTSASSTVSTGSTESYEDFVTLPTLTSSACLWLGVIINDRGDVAETNINNNTRRIVDCIDIIFPIPDMTAQIISTPTVAAAGEEMAVTRLLNNEGTADAPMFSYTYYLSNNPTISTDDIPIGTFSGAVAVNGDDYGIDILQIPSQVSQGNYFVGLIVDPDDLVDEVIEDNNTAVGPLVPVFSAAIRFDTTSLPNGTLGVDYDFGVYASGAPLALSWSVARGNLPDGISIDAASGILSGQPTAEGLFEFVLRASAGTAFAEKPFSIRVVAPTVTLQVATPSLPTALSGRPYAVQLVAVGGQVPYSWVAVSDLPVGIELNEEGLLSGTPQTQIDLPITVRVRDALDNAASADLVLNVINPNQPLQIVQIPLPEAVVGMDYCEVDTIGFEARDGTPPYTWSISGNAPAGMNMNAAGELCGTPEIVGAFPIEVRVQDATGLFDTSLFIFKVDDGTNLAVSSFALEDAEEGESYSEALTAILGSEPYTWSVVDPAALPPGIMLTGEGVLSGTPSTAGTFAFIVQVMDAQLRSDVQPLSLTVNAKPVQVTDPDGCNCVTSEPEQPWGSMAALLAIGGFFMLRRRRRTSRLLQGLTLFGTLVVLSGTSFAQLSPVPGTPYQMGIDTITYMPLSSPNVITTNVDDGQASVTLPFPFKFYDQFETSLSLGYNGAIIFPSGTSVSLGNATPGSTSNPNGWISPFWDDLRLYSQNNGHIGTQLQGTAPNRTFSIEWHNISRFGSSGVRFSMRIVLFEGSAARYDVEYSPMTGSGNFSCTMASEDQTGGRAILFAASSCTTRCNAADYGTLANRRITLIQDPGIELAAVGVEAPEFAFLGAETPVQATIQNLHGNPLGPFQIEIEAAADEMMTNPISVGTRTVSLQPFQLSTFAVTSIFPNALGESRVWLRVNVDSMSVINEVNENNNSEVSATATRLLLGAPDVAVERVTTNVATAAAGGDVIVYSRIKNVGGEVANNVDIAVMLSTNPVISRQDVQLATWNVTINPGQTINATTTVTIPAGANSGTYYLGTVADPDNNIVELNESNNGRASLDTVDIAGGALAISTTALPRGYTRETYVGILLANGATPPYTWEITMGSLPDGLRIVADSGELYGRPTTEETQTFTAMVTSSDGQQASKSLSITVGDPAEPLTIVTRGVPAAVSGQEYEFQLVVTGGTGMPLMWTLAGQPEGFTVTEAGVLTGNPADPGSFDIDLTVTDGAQTANRTVTLDIKANAALLIVPMTLDNGTYGQPYQAQLEATGGVPPVVWLLTENQRLPAGINLSANGAISGTPMQVGEFRFVVEARDSVTGGLSAKDVNTFVLVIEDVEGFDIVTDVLADGILEEGYDETIAAGGGLPPYDWTIVEGRLPEGLLARTDPNTNEFRVAGQPSEPGRTNLLIRATDAEGRSTERAFTLLVLSARPVIVTEPIDEGCTCVAAQPSANSGWLWAGLAGMLLVLSRRRR